jgi:hypothetical protein
MAARVAVTSIVRQAGPGERSGFLRVLDLEARRVVSETPVPESAFRAIDPNPRGGYRGAKGIGVLEDRLAVANSERVFVFRSSWQLAADLTHPWLGSVHDLLAEEDGILVTCTNCDLLLRLGWDGRVLDRWTWREDPPLARMLGYRRPPGFDPDTDYRDPRSTRGRVLSLVQLNAVARDGERLVLSFGRIVPPRVYLRKRVAAAAGRLGISPVERTAPRPSRLPVGEEPGSAFALVALGDDRTAEVVYRVGGVSVPNHNVLLAGGRVLYNDTDGGRLVEADVGQSAETRAVKVPGDPSYARGLASLGGDRYLVGSQRPAAVHVIDLAERRAVDSFALSADARESVYAVAVLPETFEDPPPKIAFPDQ